MLVNAMKQPSGLASCEASTQKRGVTPAHGFNESSATASFDLQNVFGSLTQSFEHVEPETQNPLGEQPLDLSLPVEGAQTVVQLSGETAKGLMQDMLPSQAKVQHVASFGRSGVTHNELRTDRDLSSSITMQTNGVTGRDLLAINTPTTSIPGTQNVTVGMEATSLQAQSNQTSVTLQTVPVQALPVQTVGSDLTPNSPSTTESAATTKPEWAPVRVDTSSGKWGEQMMQVLHDRVTLQAQQNMQEAKIRLDPPDLGKLDVLVRVEGDRLSVQINASATATREALMQVSERLRAELQEQNFVHVDVNIGSDQGQERHNHDKTEEETTIFAARESSVFQTDSTTHYSEHWLNTQA